MSKIKASKNKAKDVETPPRQQANLRQILQFIDGVVAMSPVSRQTHVQAQQALQQLSSAVNELEKLQKEKQEWQKPQKNESA